MVVGGAPLSAMIGLFAPASKYAGTVDSWIAALTADNEPSGIFVRFDPKISGAVTYTQIKAGVLQVEVSLKIVYALQKPDKSAWTRTIVTVDDELPYYNGTANYKPTTGTVWPEQVWITGYADAQCEPVNGFREPAYLSDDAAGDGGGISSGPALDPYATVTATPTPVGTAAGNTCSSISRD